VPETIAIIVTAVVACALTFTLVKLLDHLRRKDAESEARQIIGRAERTSRTAAARSSSSSRNSASR
jgi:hypothetical protein